MTNLTKKAFVIMPFDENSLSLYTGVFAPALTEAGFDVRRGDEFQTTNPITLDIERAILEADLILCEITGKNPNVFYELGLAHALGKSVLMVSRNDENIPFDISHIRVILYDDKDNEWMADLYERIKNVADNCKQECVASPLSIIGERLFRDVTEEIKNNLCFFKDTVVAFSQGKPKFRLHYLVYLEEYNKVVMKVQDQVYADKDFEIDLNIGCEKEIIICNAIKNGRLINKKLPDNHYVFYPDSPIPEKLSSVIAFPVRDRKSNVIGVVALDSTRPFDQIGIDEEDLEDIFVKLCGVVEKIVQSTGV